MRYLKSTQLNGVREPDEEVDEEYVEKFTSRETRRWFENLGARERMSTRHGVISMTSVSPDGTETRHTIFTPLPEDKP